MEEQVQLSGIRSIVRRHVARFPLMDHTDVYKLIFQAAMGSAHAVTDRGAARDWLLLELKHTGNGPDEPLVDPVSPGGRIARINLRPFRANGLDPEILLEAFVRTATVFRGSSLLLESYAEGAGSLLAAEAAPIAAGFAELMERMRLTGFPALHHSPVYRDAYHPCYRIVDTTLLDLDVIGSRGERPPLG